MNDASKDRRKSGTETPDKPARRKQREARLADALRANLKRRKAQERGRKTGGPEGAAPDDSENSG